MSGIIPTKQRLLRNDFSIEDLSTFRAISDDLKLKVDEFVRDELIKLKTQCPAALGNFCAKQEPVTSDNAWEILSLFKKAYPSLGTDMSIQEACEVLQGQSGQSDQAMLALKNALVLQSPQLFANLASKQTVDEIRNWFANRLNHPLLQSVKKLNLGCMGLTVIPRELRLLSNLEVLQLHRNNIASIAPDDFGNLRMLKELYLSNNQINAIHSNSFANLTNLEELYLDNNKIIEIPTETFSNLPNLRCLNLIHNKITSIFYKAFKNLPSLEWISFKNNEISVIPIDVFVDLPSLEWISFTTNNISWIDPRTFQNLRALTTVYTQFY